MPLFVTLGDLERRLAQSTGRVISKIANTRCMPSWACLPVEIAERVAATRHAGGYIVAVGTTSLRLLESAAAENGEIRPFAGESRLFILPGHRFRAVDMLLTNFHLPRPTLFMLVATLAGIERIKAAYTHAVAAGYRFFSYGDACLIERRTLPARLLFFRGHIGMLTMPA